MQSRSTDMHNKLQKLFLNLLVSGESYYYVNSSASGTNISI
jgi:hypothetical protein